jgi:hypothetical protein
MLEIDLKTTPKAKPNEHGEWRSDNTIVKYCFDVRLKTKNGEITATTPWLCGTPAEAAELKREIAALNKMSIREII